MLNKKAGFERRLVFIMKPAFWMKEVKKSSKKGGKAVDLKDSVAELKGIGEQRVKYLQRLGIFSVQDLLFHFPKDYGDRSDLKKIKDLELGQDNTFLASISKLGENIRIRNLTFTRVELEDETGKIYAVWYNQSYMKAAFHIGEQYIFFGKLQKKYGKKEVVSPEYEKAEEGMIKEKIVPVYSLGEGLSQKVFRGFIQKILQEVEKPLLEFLPLWMRKKYLLCERNFAIHNIHFPKDRESLLIARRRLVFEEFFLLQVALLQVKVILQQNQQGIILQNINLFPEIQNQLPFTMTSAQKKVLKEIQEDITSGKVMNRLVQGDVGSGKTAIALVVAYCMIREGFQVAMMAPTEVLAEQHYRSFQELLEPLGIKTVLLSGSLKVKEKRDVLSAVVSGEANMIVGTHAVIQKNVVYSRLGLVITDEQHRFGVRQREMLFQKGQSPHVLVMTATPIPRTLALILYGDLDISIIDELPPGRQPIDTIAVTAQYRKRIHTFIKKHIDQGRQAYIVCPMIEESENLEVKAVTSYVEKLQSELFSGYQIACVHGGIKAQEKQKIMESFVKGKIQILVATTVIEVGIHVPNAVIMLIENAERFGLAQLHQLRGRVGRGQEKSYCILINESKSKIAKERMKVMENSGDGFVISEMDLKLRGPGEFFGTRQHGLPDLKIGNLYQDIAILKEAQEAAQSFLTDKNDNSVEKDIMQQELKQIWNEQNLSI